MIYSLSFFIRNGFIDTTNSSQTERTKANYVLSVMFAYFAIISCICCIPLAYDYAKIHSKFDRNAMKQSILNSFPENVEIRFNNGTLQYYDAVHGKELELGETEVLEISLSNDYLDLWDAMLPYPYEAIPAEFIYDYFSFLSFSEWFDDDYTVSYVSCYEYIVDSIVEYRDNMMYPKYNEPYVELNDMSSEWRTGKVTKVHESDSLKNFNFTISPLEDSEGDSCTESLEEKQFTSLSLRFKYPKLALVSAKAMDRMLPPMVKSSNDSVTLPIHERMQLLSQYRSLAVLGGQHMAILKGFSFTHGQYWRYIDDDTEFPHLWLKMNMKNIKKWKPLALYTNLFCISRRNEAAFDAASWNFELSHTFGFLDDNTPSLVSKARCSREVARKHLDLWLSPAPVMLMQIGFMLFSWFVCLAIVAFRRGILLVFVYVPSAYICSNLIRHVDTPNTSFQDIANIVSYNSIVYAMIDACCFVLHELPIELPRIVADAVEYELSSVFLPWMLCTVYSSYVIVYLRMHYSRLQHEQKMDLKTESLRIAQFKKEMKGQMTPAERVKYGFSPEDDESEEEDNSISYACDDDGKVFCRICHCGIEEGRLISPCLCKGSMRFVHLECLTHWRKESRNPQSFYKCDQCQFRYSFNRTVYANVLRSALVLHVFTLAAFLLCLLLASYVTLLVDTFVLEDPLAHFLFGDEWEKTLRHTSQHGNDVDKDLVELLLPMLRQVADASVLGLQVVHLLGGFTMLGFVGFLSIGLFSAPLLLGDPRPRGKGAAGTILFYSIVGAVRILRAFYSQFKDLSGRLLEGAENRILEIGLSYEEEMARALVRQKANAETKVENSSGQDKGDVDNVVSKKDDPAVPVISGERLAGSKQANPQQSVAEHEQSLADIGGDVD